MILCGVLAKKRRDELELLGPASAVAREGFVILSAPKDLGPSVVTRRRMLL